MGCNSSKKPSPAIPKAAVDANNIEEDGTAESKDVLATSKSSSLLTDLHKANGTSGTKQVTFSSLENVANTTTPTAAATSEGGLDRREEFIGDKSADIKHVQKLNPNKAHFDLIANLESRGVIKKNNVKEAMLSTDRNDYAPSNRLDAAYEDSPLPIGWSATISAPHMHAHALDLLADHLVPGARVLDIGCGSGYVASCMARMVGPEGLVIGVDYLKPLVTLAIDNIRKTDADLLDSGRLVVLHGDGWKGCPFDNLFDCIHVGAAAETIPKPLLDQLKPGGRMVIPVGTHSQHFYQIDRMANGDYTQTQLMPVRYVPLEKTDVGPAWFDPVQIQKSTSVKLAKLEISRHDVENILLVSAPSLGSASSVEEKEIANAETPISEVKGAIVVQPPNTLADPCAQLKVNGVPSVQPSDARCRWCKDVCC